MKTRPDQKDKKNEKAYITFSRNPKTMKTVITTANIFQVLPLI